MHIPVAPQVALAVLSTVRKIAAHTGEHPIGWLMLRTKGGARRDGFHAEVGGINAYEAPSLLIGVKFSIMNGN